MKQYLREKEKIIAIVFILTVIFLSMIIFLPMETTWREPTTNPPVATIESYDEIDEGTFETGNEYTFVISVYDDDGDITSIVLIYFSGLTNETLLDETPPSNKAQFTQVISFAINDEIGNHSLILTVKDEGEHIIAQEFSLTEKSEYSTPGFELLTTIITLVFVGLILKISWKEEY